MRTFLLLPLSLTFLTPTAGLGATRPTPSTRVTLAGSRMPDLTRLARLGPVSGSTALGISVALTIRHHDSLERLVRSVSERSSPHYGQYLSVGQFRAGFAPPPAAAGRVRAWLRSSGLRVTGEAADGLAIRASGPVSAIERAFSTDLVRYREGRRHFYANADPVSLPASLAGSVRAVVGLDDRFRVSHYLSRLRDPSSTYGYTPSDLQRIYNATPLLNSGITGKGQTIGIVSGAINPSDITTFEAEYGLPQYVPQQVQVKDPRNTRLASPDAEFEMDSEVIHGLAPDARIILYNDSNEVFDSLYYTFLQMVSENRASVLSSSVGGPDVDWAAYPGFDLIGATHDLFLEAAAQGQTVLAASGDAGAYDAFADGRSYHTRLTVDYPCSDPYVTCVGGTSLQDTPDGQYGSETVWSDTDDPNNPAGSGGGISTLFARPAWQVGPGTDNTYSADTPGRMVPDVSADADPYTGYALYVVGPGGTSDDEELGGTSASAPLWAGLTALLNQDLNTRLGFFNPSLYALGLNANRLPQPPFHDVISGTNLYYPATPGYDLATGLGTPDAAALAADLLSSGSIVRTPVILISAAHVQKPRAGGFVNVSTVRAGTKARFIVTFKVVHPSGAVAARVRLYRGTANTGSWRLTERPTGAKSMTGIVTVKRAGSYTAVFSVSNGGYSASRSVDFDVKGS